MQPTMSEPYGISGLLITNFMLRQLALTDI